jgi:hypothetical protein
MTPKKKRVLMQRQHFSAPPWMLERLAAVAADEGRTVAELIRRLILHYLHDVDPEGLPRPQRIASWKRASRSLEGAGSRKTRI